MNIGRESEFVEFKKSTSETKEAMDDVASILNKHGKGTLYFGVKPNGEVIGQEIGFSTLDDIARICKEAIKPTIYPEITEEIMDDKAVVKVIFSGTERPYSSYGRYFKRVIDRAEEMTPQELKNIMASTDYSSAWENNITKYTIEDVDSDALRSFYKQATACGRLELMDVYDEEELLVGLGVMIDGKLNNAGYYLFSNKKPIVLKMATYVTDERINFSDIRRIEGNIFNLIRTANTYIKEKINWKVSDVDGTARVEIPEIPVEAIREIVVNSFAHADYRGITENEIDITPTQIEIYNPGEFPINLTPESFVVDKRKSQPRNQVILNTLYKCKDVEMFGSGFRKVYSFCNSSGIKFSYENSADGFSFVFYRKNGTLNVTKNVTINNGVRLIKNDYKVLEALKEAPTSTREELATVIGINKRTVQRSLDKLVEAKKIIRVGSKKSGYWEIL